MKQFFLLLSLFLSLFLILSCSEPMLPEPQIIYLPADEPAPIPPPESPPEIGEDPEEPPEILSMIIAYLNYDGKLFSYNNKAALVEIQDGDIKTVSVIDGTTDVIAQATGMRAWAK